MIAGDDDEEEGEEEEDARVATTRTGRRVLADAR